jgi:hypothetical protein
MASVYRPSLIDYGSSEEIMEIYSLLHIPLDPYVQIRLPTKV